MSMVDSQNVHVVFKECDHFCKMPKRAKRAKVNQEPIILVDNPMKAKHAKPPVDEHWLCLANPCRVLVVGGCGASKTKALAKDVAGKAVQMGLEKLGVPESAMGTATALAGEAFDRLGDAAERKAQSAIIGKAPTTLPGVPNAPVSGTTKRTSAGTHSKRKTRRLEGSGMTDVGAIELGHGASVSAVAFDRSVLPDGATVVNKTNALQLAY